MSAQTTDAVLPNGTGSGEAPAVQGSDGAVNSIQQPRADNQVGDARQQTRDILPGGVECGELGRERGNAPLDPGAATTAVQAERQITASTTVTVGGLLDPENSGLPRSIDEQPTGPRTPVVSTGPRSAFQPSWLGNMEVPRWFAKLGSILNTGTGAVQPDLAPSPFSGVSPFSSPPGGPTFRLRSPGRPRAISSAPTPPSSSSIPAEAIQAEVQRQLGGVLQQLQEYGVQNELLQQELEDTRARLRIEQQRNVVQDHTPLRSGGLLGDLATAHLDPGPLPEVPPVPTQDDVKFPSRYEAEPRDPQVEQSQSNPRDQPRPGGNEGPGMLRSWWDKHARSTTPPPKAAAAPNPEAPVPGNHWHECTTVTRTADAGDEQIITRCTRASEARDNVADTNARSSRWYRNSAKLSGLAGGFEFSYVRYFRIQCYMVARSHWSSGASVCAMAYSVTSGKTDY